MRTALQARPESVGLGLALVAWTYMITAAVARGSLSCCEPLPSLGQDFLAWLAMIVAMMVPTTTLSMRDLAFRSYRVRRVRAVAGYLLGYLTWWMALGVLIVAIRKVPSSLGLRTATLMCLVGVAWALIPPRGRWFRSCHRRIVVCPVGWRADLGAIQQGSINGAPCVAMCWPLMVACTFANHNLVMMIGGTALALIEKRMFRFSPRPVACGALVMAAWTLTL